MAKLSAENPLKDAFRPPIIETWARRLRTLEPAFDDSAFLAEVLAGWEDLAFGQRSARITEALARSLPADFPIAAALLVSALDPPLGPDELAPLERFLVWPQTAWTARRGRETGDFETTAQTLKEMTQRFSAEGDLRVLFELDASKALDLLADWTLDPNPHVRRLVSEGTRPRLPLAARWRRFDSDPGPILALLERLKDDPSLYVRRSVANQLNDWAKDHPDRIAGLLVRWSEGASPERKWLVSHGGRTLVKKAHPSVLGLAGIDVAEPWEITDLTVDLASCRLGGTLLFRYRLTHRGLGPAAAETDFLFGPWPGRVGAKIYKGRRVRSAGGQSFELEGRRSLANTSGRTWRPGPHRLALQVNGRILAEIQVTLV